ncbi:MAG: protein adenylyltransferase SelO [Paracoccaceae bacterium]
MRLEFDNSYARDLPGAYLRVNPDVAPAPTLLVFNEALAAELGISLGDHAAAWLSGAEVPPGAEPIAMAYAGHQFGGFSPQLGDGRAHLLGEILGPNGRRWDLHLKGSGRTAFSRGGDGKAVIGPMLREYLMGEAMHALGVPTTRALSVVATGEDVWREAGRLPGAVVARVASSHIRVGTFQFFAARRDAEGLRALLEYTVWRHFPGVDALGLFDAVAARQCRLIAAWMGLGFIHGVMNTDNMALSGETIDYGPCAFMEGFAPGTVFSSIDHQGRYAWGNQPLILGWNLARLAETLLPFFESDGQRAVEIANERLGTIAGAYEVEWLSVMRGKLALSGEHAGDAGLVSDLLAAMEAVGADWTLSFRRLGTGAMDVGLREALAGWMPRWEARRRLDWAEVMGRMNPAVIPRNHLVEQALAAATEGDMAPFRALLAAVCDPYGSLSGREVYGLPAPAGLAPHVTYCGT